MLFIMPPGHHRPGPPRYRFSTREKWIVSGVAVLTAVLAIVTVIAIASSGHKSANGCIDVAVAYSTGGSEIHQCGAEAKALCRAVGVSGGFTGQTATQVAAECRKAGLPAGPS
jgi:hypothetical protein